MEFKRLSTRALVLSGFAIFPSMADNWTTTIANQITSGATTKVGIGTATPSYSLHVKGAILAENGSAKVYVTKNSSGKGDSYIHCVGLAGTVFVVNSQQGLSAELGTNMVVDGGNDASRYALNGAKKAPFIKLNGEDGSITLFGENGTGVDYRGLTANQGVTVKGTGEVLVGSPQMADGPKKFSVQGKSYFESQVLVRSISSAEPGLVVNGLGNGTVAQFRGNLGAMVSIESDGSIVASKVITNAWTIPPDYVFEKDYDLKPLKHVAKYLKENKHLPEIPSAKEITKNGVDLADMNLKLLKKVEELTLYVIDLQNQVDDLKRPANHIKRK